MLLLGLMKETEERSYGPTSLLSRLKRLKEYELYEELTKNAVVVALGRYIGREGSRS
jgi:hypothetical protein